MEAEKKKIHVSPLLAFSDKKIPEIGRNFLFQDGKISYEEFAAMMKAGTDWRKASRQYSRERFNRISSRLIKDGSLQTRK